jgi:hypothetical protein
MMYLRFETYRQNETSDTNYGVFQAAMSLSDTGILKPYEQDILDANLEWLKMHLKSPACLRDDHHFRAICWFHPRAKKPITKIRVVVEILKEYGILIQMIKTKDPGIIIYEDGWQVVAKQRKRRLHMKSSLCRCQENEYHSQAN